MGTYSIVSKKCCKSVIVCLREGLDGLLLSTHSEQGLEDTGSTLRKV